MQVSFTDSVITAWQSTVAQITRYKGSFAKKSVRQRKLDRMELLNCAITTQWQTALELSRITSIPFHQAVKLLQIAQWRYDIETKRIDWIDECKRHRTRTLYRRAIKPVTLSSLWGFKPLEVPASAKVRVHICKDD